jgi:hypothetical protein
MDHLGNLLADYGKFQHATWFYSSVMHRLLLEYTTDHLGDLSTIDVYHTIFREPLPSSAVSTIDFFLNVSRKPIGSDIVQTRWILVKFKVREGLAMLHDPSGAEDVFQGAIGGSNKQLLLERANILFKLCDITPREIEIQFVKGLMHGSEADSGPLCLEEAEGDFKGTTRTATSSGEHRYSLGLWSST